MIMIAYFYIHLLNIIFFGIPELCDKRLYQFVFNIFFDQIFGIVCINYIIELKYIRF